MFGFVGVSHTPSAQTQVNQPRAYNPYPPGILPTDLDEEMARVRREVQFIFNEALNESSSMKRLTNGERCRIRLWQVIHPRCGAAGIRRSIYSAS